MRAIKKHLLFYRSLVLFTLKAKMEYRFNFFLQMFYGPAYIFILFLLVQVAYTKTATLVGWNRDEAMLLFSIYNLLYTTSIMLFIGSVRDLVWTGLNQGKLDLIMTKPINTQFFATFSKPEIQQVLLVTSLLILFVRQMIIFAPTISFFQVIAFIIVWLAGVVINYLVITTYATLAFYMTKAQQIVEIYDKATDHGHNPTPMYPASVRIIFVSILPIAFFGYVPTAVLLGKISWQIGCLPILLIPLFYSINQFAWERAIKEYSSASS